jgi:hypothetical protein
MMNTPRLAAQFLGVAIRDTARLAARCFIRISNAARNAIRAVVFTLLLSSCAPLPPARGYYTPVEIYQNAAALGGKTVTVHGAIEIESTFCTEVFCPADNPCCNSCYYFAVFPVDANHSIWLSGNDAGCRGNSCRADCLLVTEGRMYEIVGTLRSNPGPIVYLEILEWKPVD